MKVLLVNGSPNEHGCTNRALEEIQTTLAQEGVQGDIFWLGTQPISGCIACNGCKQAGQCVIQDKVNEFSQLAKDYDGYIFGSPVYYASANGTISSFMDRLFYSNHMSGSHTFYLKPAAAVVSARRAGTTASLDQLNKYFQLLQMPIVSSCYWNEVHGYTPEEVEQDREGLHVMRTLARNMAWMLKVKQAGLEAGVPMPTQDPETYVTNFIR